MTNNELTKIAKAAGFHIEGEKIKLHCNSKINLTEMMAKFADIFEDKLLSAQPQQPLHEAVAEVVVSPSGQIHLTDGKVGHFDISKYIGKKFYTK